MFYKNAIKLYNKKFCISVIVKVLFLLLNMIDYRIQQNFIFKAPLHLFTTERYRRNLSLLPVNQSILFTRGISDKFCIADNATAVATDVEKAFEALVVCKCGLLMMQSIKTRKYLIIEAINFTSRKKLSMRTHCCVQLRKLQYDRALF